MNMISQVRQRVQKDGVAIISVDQFNQLQSEWITRASIEVSAANPVHAIKYDDDHPVTSQIGQN